MTAQSLLVGLATDTKQDEAKAVLANILTALQTLAGYDDGVEAALAPLATQTTAAAILAKLSGDPATQTTLAAILAKLIAAPSTEAKQDIAKAVLDSILAKLPAAPATDATLTSVLTALSGTPRRQLADDAGEQLDYDLPTLVMQASDYPAGAIPIGGAISGAHAALTVTLRSNNGKRVYVRGFAITSGGATAAGIQYATLRFTVIGARNSDGTTAARFAHEVKAGATLVSQTIVNFGVGIAAVDSGASVVMDLPDLGAGNTNASIVIWGYLL